MSAHTPGPWTWTSYDVLLAADYVDVMRGWGDCNDSGISINNDADKPLIAAAPELLEALEGLLFLAESHFSDQVQREHISFCRAVIAKAKGTP